MASNQVKKSLHKFLNDGLSTFVTYDSSQSDLIDITGLYSSVDIVAPVTDIVLTQGGINFNTNTDLVGQLLNVDFMGETDTIIAWNDTTSTITLQTGLTQDLLASYEVSLMAQSLVYMKSPHSLVNKSTQLHHLGRLERYDLFLKVKDDSDKTKIDTLIKNIRDLIYSNSGNFVLYEDDLVTRTGYGKIKIQDIDEKEIVDVNNDFQSVLVSFLIEYWTSY